LLPADWTAGDASLLHRADPAAEVRAFFLALGPSS
jgi:hypothetical protein